MTAVKRMLAAAFALLLVLALAACGESPTPAPTSTPAQTPAPSSAAPAETPTAEPTPSPTLTTEPTETATEEPTATPDAVDSAGSGAVIFDIYQSSAQRDINFDGTAEDISFAAGAAKSALTINGTAYDVVKPNLAQEFAITDIDTSDKYMEFVFTDAYNADLADSEKAYSWLYFWNGTKLTLMGGLMDVKFAGAWRSTFKAADVFDGKGQITCLARSQELTDLWYMAYYQTTGTGRKLYEWRHTATPLGDPTVLTCKTVCVILADHKEAKRDDPTYMSSEYDNYWIPTLSPTTLGRILNPAEGIKLIAQPGDKLTIVGIYGTTWFKVKTQDNYTGWIFCKGGNVGAYHDTVGWTSADMFDGIVVAG